MFFRRDLRSNLSYIESKIDYLEGGARFYDWYPNWLKQVQHPLFMPQYYKNKRAKGFKEICPARKLVVKLGICQENGY